MTATLQALKDRCRIEGDHWIWAGGLSNGWPAVYAPDHTKGDGELTKQNGRRAAWHLKSGEPIPNGWRVFGTCEEKRCVSPAHMVCCHPSEEGARVAASGKLKGQIARIVANRATGRKTSSLTKEQVDLILVSPKTGRQLAKELGANRTTVSRIRTGQATAFQPVGGMFSSLMR
jgi:hypothetical protein